MMNLIKLLIIGKIVKKKFCKIYGASSGERLVTFRLIWRETSRIPPHLARDKQHSASSGERQAAFRLIWRETSDIPSHLERDKQHSA